MLGVRRTAGITKAKRMPVTDPGIRASKGLGERLRTRLPHHLGAAQSHSGHQGIAAAVVTGSPVTG
jgi:hypothetical protein